MVQKYYEDYKDFVRKSRRGIRILSKLCRRKNIKGECNEYVVPPYNSNIELLSSVYNVS